VNVIRNCHEMNTRLQNALSRLADASMKAVLRSAERGNERGNGENMEHSEHPQSVLSRLSRRRALFLFDMQRCIMKDILTDSWC
jgi:hypothetical protein